MEKLLMKGAPILSTLLAVIVTAVALALPRVSADAALADDQTVTLAVEKMYCAACPLTVKTAIEKVAGVKDAKVDYQKKQAVVTFDPTKTTAEAVAAASTTVGYPARVVKTGS